MDSAILLTLTVANTRRRLTSEDSNESSTLLTRPTSLEQLVNFDEDSSRTMVLETNSHDKNDMEITLSNLIYPSPYHESDRMGQLEEMHQLLDQTLDIEQEVHSDEEEEEDVDEDEVDLFSFFGYSSSTGEHIQQEETSNILSEDGDPTVPNLFSFLLQGLISNESPPNEVLDEEDISIYLPPPPSAVALPYSDSVVMFLFELNRHPTIPQPLQDRHGSMYSQAFFKQFRKDDLLSEDLDDIVRELSEILNDHIDHLMSQCPDDHLDAHARLVDKLVADHCYVHLVKVGEEVLTPYLMTNTVNRPDIDSLRHYFDSDSTMTSLHTTYYESIAYTHIYDYDTFHRICKWRCTNVISKMCFIRLIDWLSITLPSIDDQLCNQYGNTLLLRIYQILSRIHDMYSIYAIHTCDYLTYMLEVFCEYNATPGQVLQPLPDSDRECNYTLFYVYCSQVKYCLLCGLLLTEAFTSREQKDVVTSTQLLESILSHIEPLVSDTLNDLQPKHTRIMELLSPIDSLPSDIATVTYCTELLHALPYERNYAEPDEEECSVIGDDSNSDSDHNGDEDSDPPAPNCSLSRSSSSCNSNKRKRDVYGRRESEGDDASNGARSPCKRTKHHDNVTSAAKWLDCFNKVFSEYQSNNYEKLIENKVRV